MVTLVTLRWMLYLFPSKVSTKLNNEYKVWSRNDGEKANFKLDITIEYPELDVSYYPGFWQVNDNAKVNKHWLINPPLQLLKWGWVQYLSLLIVFIYFFRAVKEYVFSQRLFYTRQVKE